jgi:hypothetical protein
MADPLEFCRVRLPSLFAQTHDALQPQGSAEPVGTRVRFSGEGGGELHWTVTGRELCIVAASELPAFGYALELPARAAAYAIDRFERGSFQPEQVGGMLTMLATQAAREAFSSTTYAFELRIADVPVLGEVCLRVSLGTLELDAPAELTLEAHFDDLADAREQGLRPHQFFMAGKLKMDGDVAKAMMLGMALAEIGQ